jgi:hypothetical protein
LLDSVVEDGHVLTEAEVELLFASRGADFDAVCRAAGKDHNLALPHSRCQCGARARAPMNARASYQSYFSHRGHPTPVLNP